MPGPSAEIPYDEAKWGERFDPKNEDDLNKETVNGYILWHMDYYKGRYDDIVLWEYFREDFEGWTKDTFALGNNRLVGDFRDFCGHMDVMYAEMESLLPRLCKTPLRKRNATNGRARRLIINSRL